MVVLFDSQQSRLCLDSCTCHPWLMHGSPFAADKMVDRFGRFWHGHLKEPLPPQLSPVEASPASDSTFGVAQGRYSPQTETRCSMREGASAWYAARTPSIHVYIARDDGHRATGWL